MNKEKVIYEAKNDPQFQSPVIDVNEDRTRALENGAQKTYRYIHGYFSGTNLKFSYCFPMKEDYQGRFFQHLSPFPGPDEELAALDKTGEDDLIAFALTHGGCYVESNMAPTKILLSSTVPPQQLLNTAAAWLRSCMGRTGYTATCLVAVVAVTRL